MLYIYRSSCISPQQTFGLVDLETLKLSVENQLAVLEPSYIGIPPGMLRRMGKAVKISVGAAMALIKDGPSPDGIIIGSGNGGLEDCVRFLDQIIQYEEGMLTPANFVQSTANAMAGQIGMLSRNQAYNITHVHRGLAFEAALLDAMMLSAEAPSKTFLLGGVDEISSYNNNIEVLSGAFKAEPISSLDLYTSNTPGTLAGEGTAMFLVGGDENGSRVGISALETLHTTDVEKVVARLDAFLLDHLPEGPDLLLTGENGDRRLQLLYEAVENRVGEDKGIARFKHMSGEHPSVSALGTWLAMQILTDGNLPAHMVKRPMPGTRPDTILLYNSYKGYQHSFTLLSTVGGSPS